MRISVIHPSKGRPEMCFNTAEKWIKTADNHVQYIISLDKNDTSNYVISSHVIPLKSDNRSAIDAINKAAKIAYGDILIVVSDDTDCPPHWDTFLLKHLKGKSDFCAKVDDGLQPTLVTMPIVDRIFYERYGYIYHPDYLHMHCDQELTSVAIMTGKYIKLPLSFPHLHYTSGATPYDAVYAKNNATWVQGETLFNERLKTNFGLNESEIVKPYSEIQWR
jgi:hypothetical protein